MRILGFSKKWPKLEQPEFTTFRFARNDKDWEVGEAVQVVYKPRSKGREPLGNAQIISKESRDCGALTKEEAIEDGFVSRFEMFAWITRVHGTRWAYEEMNKLTLEWIQEDERL